MKTRKKDITVGNSFIYYYANLIDRIYGLVIRRGGENVVDQHYVGRWPARARTRRGSRPTPDRAPEPDQPQQVDLLHPAPVSRGRWGTDAATDEVVLFRYRKRLLLGRCEDIGKQTVTIVSEDRRRLRLQRTHLLYLTGHGATYAPSPIDAWAADRREAGTRFDLREVWELARDEGEALRVGEILGLCGLPENDSAAVVALCFHLDGACPYFNLDDGGLCLPIAEGEAIDRAHQRARRRDIGLEREEFAHWFSSEEPYDPDTLTKRQQGWVEELKQYTLWGSDARGWRQTKKLLRETGTDGSESQEKAFLGLVRKGVWDEDENLDLHRREIPTDFPQDALDEASDPAVAGEVAGWRWRRKALTIVIPELPQLSISLRRRWLGGYDLGLHLPNVARIPAGSALDRAASDRMATLHLPDRRVPMLPPPVANALDVGTGDTSRRAISVSCRLDQRLTVRKTQVRSTIIRVSESLSPTDVESILSGRDHPFRRTLQRLHGCAKQLRDDRIALGALAPSGLPHARLDLDEGRVGVKHIDPDDAGRTIVRELTLLAAVEIGRYCIAHNLPTIFESRDAPVDGAFHIDDPHVRRHETGRRMGRLRLDAVPEFHSSLGVTGLLRVTRPLDAYPDLIVQRQVEHHLATGEILYTREAVDEIRYRAPEALREANYLRRRRERYWTIKHLSSRRGDVLPAVVLHVRRDGLLVELLDLPLKTVVRASGRVEPGQRVRIRIGGVDLWHARLFATVNMT